MLSLFDTYVGSVLNYGCEIWRFDVEKSTATILENSLGVKKKCKFCSCLLRKWEIPIEGCQTV